MWMAAIGRGELTGTSTGGAPLAEELAVRVKDDDTVIAVAVGNVNGSRLVRLRIGIRIHRDIGGLIQQGLAAVVAWTTTG